MPKTSKTEVIRMRCSKKWKKSVEALAINQDRSIADILRDAVNQYTRTNAR